MGEKEDFVIEGNGTDVVDAAQSANVEIAEESQVDDGEITFTQRGQDREWREVMKFCRDGTVEVNGKKVTKDIEVYEGFKAWLDESKQWSEKEERAIALLPHLVRLADVAVQKGMGNLWQKEAVRELKAAEWDRVEGARNSGREG